MIPEFLNDMLLREYGEELSNQIKYGYNQNRNTTFRINTIKSNDEEIDNEVKKLKVKYQKIDNYYVLPENMEAQIEELEIYKDGKIYMQSISSMLPPIVLNPKPKENILDMCAAPGGKTTQICALSNNQAYITACEKNPIRMQKLIYNINKQGCKGVSTINIDARKLDDYLKFDKILLDVPCSGSGTINENDKDISKHFTMDLLNGVIKTQKELIKKAIKLLKPGGILIYSTCSILKEENEDIISNVLSKNVHILPISLNYDIPQLPVTIPGTICVKPCKEYEGFFVAKIVKNI